MRSTSRAALLLLALAAAGCDRSPTGDDDGPRFRTPVEMATLGLGEVPERTTSELWVHDGWGYTGTYGVRDGNAGNVVKVWRTTGTAPALVDSVLVPGAPAAALPAGADEGHGGHGGLGVGPSTISDVQVSDDGRLLVVSTEGGPGSIVVYDRADPARPALLSRFASESTAPGVHTAELARVGGRLYAFLSVNPRSGIPARLVIVDLADPRAPREVWSGVMGRPYQHDVFVRDGILFTAEWDDGVGIWDVGGGGRGGSPANPVRISRVETVGGNAHNLWWFHDPRNGSRRYLFVGEETSRDNHTAGDVHVVDVSDLAAPREVAFYHLDEAGTHNFSVDERRGILYAAFYEAGVRALDIRGDLGRCDAAARAPDGRCDLKAMGREAGRGLTAAARPVFVWGVHFTGGALYASDMQNGLWKLDVGALGR
jgi:hypothetical protein